MPSKLQFYSQLADHTARQLTGSLQTWTSFLDTAARLYKYPYHEQLMIYAQRPDATACADYDLWNNTMRRYVRRGSRGIALIDTSGDDPKIKYVFDISDTGGGERSRRPYLWTYRDEHYDAVTAALERRFDVDAAHGIAEQLEAIAARLVYEYWNDNQHDILGIVDGSFLDEYDDFNVGAAFRNAAVVSATYAMLSRCGLGPERFFNHEDFLNVFDFNTPDTVAALGTAVSQVSEQVLRQIEVTIKNYEREKNAERSQSHDRTDLSEERRLSDPRSDAERAGEDTAEQVRENEEEVSAGAPPDTVESDDPERDALPSPTGDRYGGEQPSGTDDPDAGESRGLDGGTESIRPAEMDRIDERLQSAGRGNDTGGAGVRLTAQPTIEAEEQISLFPTEAEQIEIITEAESAPAAPFAFSLSQENVDHFLRLGSNTEDARTKTALEFMKQKPMSELTSFVKSIYHDGYGLKTDGGNISSWAADDGLHIIRGNSARHARTAQIISWEDAAARIGELLEQGRFATNVELAEAPGYERRKAAESLWYLTGEMSDEAREQGWLPTLRENWRGGFPDATERLTKLLEDPETRRGLVSELEAFAEAWRQNHDLMRFRFYNPERSLRELAELSLPRREYASDMAEMPHVPSFITEDEIDAVLSRGSNISGAAGRIYSFWQQPHTPKEKADYLKNEYGTGGGNSAVSHNFHSWEDHSSKGIVLKKPYAEDVTLSWAKVAKRIDALMAKDRYLSPEAKAEWEKTQEPAQPPARELTQEDIDEQLRTMFPDIETKRAVVRYMNEHGREKETAAWLARQHYGTDNTEPLHIGLAGRDGQPGDEIVLTWPKIQRRIAQLIKAGRFYTQEEYENLDDVDPVAIREHLAQVGIVNGELTDPAALERDPFIRQVVADAEQIATEDRPEPEASAEYHEETTAFYPGEENGLPYDIEIRTLHIDGPEHEPPAPVADNFRITDDHLGEGGPKAKFRANMDAINLLHELELEDRMATKEEQEILSRYVGWGGLTDAFDETKEAWADEFRELYVTLSPEEYAAARASTLNAHYTSPTVIRAIYEAVGHMGFRSGNILEPSMGVGNFFGMLPEEMRSSRLYGVELDSITGRIAKQLYPKANITVAGFETTDRRDFYDLAVGNVPFGNYQVDDRAYNKLGFSIHNYFFAKALDQVRPGGVIAFVTSRYTMDAKDTAVRKYLAQRAELLGAMRLPNNAFRANAGTDVVSDIIFLQKRDHPIDTEPEWVHLSENDDGFPINSYFADHPEMILGRQSSGSTQYGHQDFTVLPIEGLELGDQLHDAIKYIRGTYEEAELPELGEGEEVSETLPADPNVKNYSFTIVDGEVYYRENSIMVRPELNATAKERVKGMVELRDCVRTLIDLQMDEFTPDSAITEKQAELNRRYDAFTAKYGLINDRGNRLAFSDDDSYYLLCSLEVLDENGELERKADFFSKRTIKQQHRADHVDTAVEALGVSIGERACVDLPFMASLLGGQDKIPQIVEDLQGVIYKDPTTGPFDYAEGGEHWDKGWQTADEYLSGNVRRKLRQAQRATEQYPEFRSNVDSLIKAQPRDLEASEIEVRLGTTWIDKEYFQQFMYETFDTPFYLQRRIQVHYSPYTAEWQIESKSSITYNNVAAYTTYGTDRASAYRLLEDALNLRDTRIYDTVTDPDGKERRVLNAKETTLAAQKQQLIKDAFKDWIWKDPERRAALVKQYNEEMNSTRPREYDGSHIVFSGMNPEITLRPHQRDAIAHVIYGGNTLLAHEVGAGKTFEMVAAAMESKRLGLCSKSIFVVPNHLTDQWAAEFLRLYPSANILVTTKKDFQKHNRKKFCARIATGDYDAVIIGHSQFEKIPISPERQIRLIEEQIDEITNGIEEVKENNGERFTIKELERTKKSLEARLKKLLEGGSKDDVVTFEQLGVDRMFVDESDNYKNLFLYTKMRNVAGLSATDAQKSSDMFSKCRYMDELTGGRGIVFATGTPVSNSMTELYTIQRYLQYDRLQELGMGHFDCWASRFGETTTALELAPEGTGYRARTRFAKFFNLPELMNLFKEVADIKTADQLDLPTPEVEFHNFVSKPTEIQKEMVKALSERASRVHSGAVDAHEDNMLKITSDGRKLGLDQRIINPLLPDEDGTKVNQCVGNILQFWRDGESEKLTQLVFCDISTPKGRSVAGPVAAKAAGGILDDTEIHALETLIPLEEEKERPFTIYEDIRQKLIAGGMLPEQVAFIHDADTEVRKRELFAKVRSGQVRVLIGSTQKMGAGTNVQDRLIAMHDLDCPWRPRDLTQRKGRIERQGNQNPLVHVCRYVTEGTFDAYLWQTVENKQKFISQIMTSKSPVRSCEDVNETALSFAEIKALCAGDPRIKERMDLDVDVSKLKIMKADHQSKQYRLEDQLLKYYPEQIEQNKGFIRGFEADMKTLEAHPLPQEGFVGMVIRGDTLIDKENAGAALIDAVKEVKTSDPLEIGTYRGFSVSVEFSSFTKGYSLTLKGDMSHRVELGEDPRGNLTRIDNALAKMPDRLKAVQAQLDNLYKQQEAAKAEVGKPFPYEAELTAKTARLVELDLQLNLNGGRPQPQPEQTVAKSDRPSILERLKQPLPQKSSDIPKTHILEASI